MLSSDTLHSAGAVRAAGRWRERAAELAETFGTPAIAVVLFAAFALTSPVFAVPANIRNILIQIAVVGVAAIGETMVMLIGGLDLSVGAVVLLSSVIIADLNARQSIPIAVAVLAGVSAGALIGLLNGVLTTVVGIEPILATLGTALMAAGFGKLLLNLSWIQVSDPFLRSLAQTNVVANLPRMVVVMLVLYLLAALAMQHTPFGRFVYAIGGNRRAARLSGLPLLVVMLGVYTLGGVMAAVAGLLELGKLGIVSQNDGLGLEFQAIIAALIGGLSVTAGGVGRVERTLLGALLVGMITNYETLRGVPPTYQQALLGGILLLAVLADHVLRARRA
ncbi:MAG: ABC transporter permease [Chloroflexi bacterium]|nr:ABC transporter permease [Chloroflexota bacterium]